MLMVNLKGSFWEWVSMPQEQDFEILNQLRLTYKPNQQILNLKHG